MSEKYRPSNGTEGDMFMDQWCFRCAKNPLDPEQTEECNIVSQTFWRDVDDPEYPAEWTYKDGEPCCTAWVKK